MLKRWSRSKPIVAVGLTIVALFVFLGGNFAATAGNSIAVDDPFGLWGGRDQQPLAKKAGASFLRTIIHWQEIEPVKGAYRFSSLDAMVVSGQKNQIEQVVTLRSLSKWGGNLQAQIPATIDPDQYNNGYPSDPVAWADFVAAVVERYDGDGFKDMPNLSQPVKYWQIENEWHATWKDTMENFVKHTQETSLVIKKTDPSAKTIGGAITGQTLAAYADGYMLDRDYIDTGRSDETRKQWTRNEASQDEGVLEYKRLALVKFIQGTQGYVDYQDVHSYTQDPYTIIAENQWIRDQYAAHGYQPKLVSFENAGPFFDYSESEHSVQVVTRALVGLEHGYLKVAWAPFMSVAAQSTDKNYVRLGLVQVMDDGSFVRKPAFYNYKVMTTLLAGITEIERITQTDENAYVYKATRPEGNVYIMWHRNATSTVSVAIPTKNAVVVKSIVTPGQTYPEYGFASVDSGMVSVSIDEAPVFVFPKRK